MVPKDCVRRVGISSFLWFHSEKGNTLALSNKIEMKRFEHNSTKNKYDHTYVATEIYVVQK